MCSLQHVYITGVACNTYTAVVLPATRLQQWCCLQHVYSSGVACNKHTAVVLPATRIQQWCCQQVAFCLTQPGSAGLGIFVHRLLHQKTDLLPLVLLWSLKHKEANLCPSNCRPHSRTYTNMFRHKVTNLCASNFSPHMSILSNIFTVESAKCNCWSPLVVAFFFHLVIRERGGHITQGSILITNIIEQSGRSRIFLPSKRIV